MFRQCLDALPADGSVPFMPAWKWVHTPGYCPGHVSLWRENDRALIVGDAFIITAAGSAYATAFRPELHGPARYFTIDWQASKRSVQALAALRPDFFISGHGRAMQGPQVNDKLQVLARDFDRIAVPRQGRYVITQPERRTAGLGLRHRVDVFTLRTGSHMPVAPPPVRGFTQSSAWPVGTSDRAGHRRAYDAEKDRGVGSSGGLSQISALNGMLTIGGEISAPDVVERTE